jgi:hypothetical protein
LAGEWHIAWAHLCHVGFSGAGALQVGAIFAHGVRWLFAACGNFLGVACGRLLPAAQARLLVIQSHIPTIAPLHAEQKDNSPCASCLLCVRVS